mgnify:CR=1 FL=1
MPLVVGETVLYTVEEAAKVFGVSRQTLWRAVRLGLVPTVRYAYRAFVKKEDVIAWKEKHYRVDMAQRRKRKAGHKN